MAKACSLTSYSRIILKVKDCKKYYLIYRKLPRHLVKNTSRFPHINRMVNTLKRQFNLISVLGKRLYWKQDFDVKERRSNWKWFLMKSIIVTWGGLQKSLICRRSHMLSTKNLGNTQLNISLKDLKMEYSAWEFTNIMLKV